MGEREREREREREKKWELASSQKRRISNSYNNPIKFFSDSLVLGAGQLTKCKNSTLKTKGFIRLLVLGAGKMPLLNIVYSA